MVIDITTSYRGDNLRNFCFNRTKEDLFAIHISRFTMGAVTTTNEVKPQMKQKKHKWSNLWPQMKQKPQMK